MLKSKNYIAVPPGMSIKEQLEDRGMSQKEFAARMDMSEKHISHLLNGEVQLTPETALKLEMVLGVPASFWNNLEGIYREKLVKIEAERELSEDEEIAKRFPYAEMAKLSWVPATSKISEKVMNLRKYFEVVRLSLLGKEQVMRVACRRLAITDKGDAALMAWVEKAKLMARSVETSPINIKKLNDSVPEIRKMSVLSTKTFVPRLRSLLSECGVALVFVPHLSGSYLHGASFQDGSKVVLALTARGKDADRFWFSLFHELGHIVLGHLSKVGGTSEEDEVAADRWAGDTLIDPSAYRDFVLEGKFSELTVTRFAKQQGIDPGIVVGRLQKDRFVKFGVLDSLKRKYEIGPQP